MTLKLVVSCYCFVLLLFWFSIENTVKKPFNCLQCDTQTVLVMLLFFICYWKYDKATVQLSPMWHSNCSCLVIVLFCYWKYGKATVQLSTIWHSNCSGLVIVFFAFGNTVKQPFNCLQYDTQTVLVLLLFCFHIGNTVKQPFNCLQYDTQTVLILFCYWKYSKATAQLFLIWHSNWSCLVIVLSCYCSVLLLEIQ